MSWYVEQFRQAVSKGHYDRERARSGRVAMSVGYAAASKLISYDVFGVGDKRPDLLNRPSFLEKRIWVARTIGAIIAGRPAEMTIVSSELERDKLYQGISFGLPEQTPLYTRWRTLPQITANGKQNQYEQALLWARKPGSNPEIHHELILPEHIEAELNAVLPRPPAEAK